MNLCGETNTASLKASGAGGFMSIGRYGPAAA